MTFKSSKLPGGKKTHRKERKLVSKSKALVQPRRKSQKENKNHQKDFLIQFRSLLALTCPQRHLINSCLVKILKNNNKIRPKLVSRILQRISSAKPSCNILKEIKMNDKMQILQ